MNEEEIENFFGIDLEEMQRLVKHSSKYFNEPARNTLIDKDDEVELHKIKYLSNKKEL